MKIRFIFLTLVCQISFSFAQNPVSAPKKNGKYEKKEKKQVIASGNCKAGFKTGTWTYFKSSGEKDKEEDFDEKGFLLSTREFNYDSSGFVQQFTIVNGERNGQYKLYAYDRIHVSGWYVHGQKDSLWVYYREINFKTNLWKTEKWKSGILKEVLKYYQSGQLFHSTTFDVKKNIAEENYFDTTGAKIILKMYNGREESIHDSIFMDSLMRFHRDASKVNPDNYFSYNQEKFPEFPGGQSMIMSFVNSNIKYQRNSDQQGKVSVSFFVNEYGEVCDIKVMKHNDKMTELESQAIHVVEMMPPWQPATQNGRPVQVMLNLPFNFSPN